MRNMTQQDLHRVNMLLSRSFTQARYDDGYKVTRVPMCRPDYLEMYYATCPEGCFVIEDSGQVLAASFCHIWGKTGWIGPLAVAPEKHLLGLGKQILMRSVEHLKQSGCTTIGLETNPRSNRNLGFYGKLGFLPKTLVIDMMRRVPEEIPEAESSHRIKFFSRCTEAERIEFLANVRLLTRLVAPDVDYTPSIVNLHKFKYGETILFLRHKIPIAFVLAQTLPTSAEERSFILRMIAFLAHPKTPLDYLKYIIRDLERFAAENSLDQILFRIPATSGQTFQYLLADGFRIIFTDLRMTLRGYEEKVDAKLLHFNRWA